MPKQTYLRKILYAFLIIIAGTNTACPQASCPPDPVNPIIESSTKEDALPLTADPALGSIYQSYTSQPLETLLEMQKQVTLDLEALRYVEREDRNDIELILLQRRKGIEHAIEGCIVRTTHNPINPITLAVGAFTVAGIAVLVYNYSQRAA